MGLALFSVISIVRPLKGQNPDKGGALSEAPIKRKVMLAYPGRYRVKRLQNSWSQQFRWTFLPGILFGLACLKDISILALKHEVVHLFSSTRSNLVWSI